MIAINLKNKLRTITVVSLFIVLPFLGKAQHFIGIKEGIRTSSLLFKPAQNDSSTVHWLNFGLVYKYYNYPWVGLQTGVNYAEKGFVWNDTTRCYKMIEVPLLSQFHYETWHLRFLINVGAYISYALSAEQSYTLAGTTMKEGYIFTDRDRRIEYGLHLGGGIGFMFKPFELQFEAGYQFSYSYMMDAVYKDQPIIYTHFNHWIFSIALLVQL